MGGSKETWSKAAHQRHANRLKEEIKNPTTPSSYYKKKLLEARMTDDFPRY